jgi:DmsE family decaheme c-type cytochrome
MGFVRLERGEREVIERTWILACAFLALATAAGAQEPPAFVGEQACTTCHAVINEHFSHTVHAKAFRQNPRDEREARVCEACHGPGSLHVKDPADKAAIIGFSRRADTTPAAMNAQCLSCHQGGARLHWPGSMHESSQLACSDCHNPMARLSREGLLRRQSVSETCYGCHAQQRAEFRRRSHMPLPEGKMSCTDCHNPHGSTTRPMLQASSVNALCHRCHAEKRGPFIWEHAPVRESCLNCHEAHGSNHEKLLTSARPFLCQQCHANTGHPTDLLTRAGTAAGAAPDARVMARGCLTCHAQVHGSNSPSGARLHR